MRDRHAVDAALLRVGGLLGPDGQIEVELVERGGAGLAAAGAGQHAEADDPGGALSRIGSERTIEHIDKTRLNMVHLKFSKFFAIVFWVTAFYRQSDSV